MGNLLEEYGGIEGKDLGKNVGVIRGLVEAFRLLRNKGAFD